MALLRKKHDDCPFWNALGHLRVVSQVAEELRRIGGILKEDLIPHQVTPVRIARGSLPTR